jgi:hypothetical protein
MKKHFFNVILVGCIAVLCVSCVAGPNPLEGKAGRNGKVAGFWNGLWDGTIAPITFVISLFNNDVEIYNPNSSGWYPFGFVLGSGILAGSGSTASSRR